MGENDENKLLKSFELMEVAEKVTLDEDLGFDLENLDEAIDYYQDETQGFKLNIPSFDKRIGKGFREKTLHAIAAPAGIGKSATMAAFVSEFLKQEKNVIVFTLEMDEREWAKRIYANILNKNIKSFEESDPNVFKMAWENIKNNLGKLIIKEYPSYSITSLNIEDFLEKYEQKTGIKNPIVFVDYLGLMNSSRVDSKSGGYEYLKSIAAELRGIAQKRNITIFTAVQTNRSSYNNLEAGMETVSDSIGVGMFVDSLIMLRQTKEMKELGEINVGFEKNRMSGITDSFKIGFDYNYMRFIELNEPEIKKDENGLEISKSLFKL
jgi:replicative DNA helicase